MGASHSLRGQPLFHSDALSLWVLHVELFILNQSAGFMLHTDKTGAAC